jgi:hypothetical protein
MTKLNQLIAIEKGVKNAAQNEQTRLYHLLDKTALTSGITRSYTPVAEDGDQLPSESTLVQIKTGDVLKTLSTELTRLFDVVLTKETANTRAAADIVVDGQVLVAKVPVTYLLFLEKELEKINAFVGRIPVLDPAETWSYDPAIGAWRTEETKTVRNKKIPKNWVKYDATKEHPAQVEIYHEDVLAGTWSTVKFSGGLPADEIKAIAARVDKVRTAVKFAREEANGLEVTDFQAGKSIFDYLFA